jgi:hypothetical protein
MYDRIGGFVAGIGGAVESVVGAGRCSVYTSLVGCAGLDAITEGSVVAQGVIRCMCDAVRCLVAAIDGAI